MIIEGIPFEIQLASLDEFLDNETKDFNHNKLILFYKTNESTIKGLRCSKQEKSSILKQEILPNDPWMVIKKEEVNESDYDYLLVDYIDNKLRFRIYKIKNKVSSHYIPKADVEMMREDQYEKTKY